VTLALAWPLVIAAVVWPRADGFRPAWTAFVYLAASGVCHQMSARSFHTAGVQWPVCARCAGLYLAAPVGAVAAMWRARPMGSRRPDAGLPPSAFFVLAAVPTALTLAIEWSGLSPLSNVVRFVSALPLGATIMYLIVRVVSGPARTIG
jgi:uncharacterized membrane protein